ncbi:MAG TPA: hypothetical protein VHS07_06295 [Candidatus Binataceae bacterium]|nr:hypothetical protein [Candidatus Binataceae bacterium]
MPKRLNVISARGKCKEENLPSAKLVNEPALDGLCGNLAEVAASPFAQTGLAWFQFNNEIEAVEVSRERILCGASDFLSKKSAARAGKAKSWRSQLFAQGGSLAAAGGIAGGRRGCLSRKMARLGRTTRLI